MGAKTLPGSRARRALMIVLICGAVYGGNGCSSGFHPCIHACISKMSKTQEQAHKRRTICDSNIASIDESQQICGMYLLSGPRAGLNATFKIWGGALGLPGRGDARGCAG